jgi:hypothetical protein
MARRIEVVGRLDRIGKGGFWEDRGYRYAGL